MSGLPFRWRQLHGIIALAVACGPASAALLSVQGEARDPTSGRLLYREDHLLRENGDAPVERLVLYRCPDGTAFARKRVDYAASASAPAFSLTDARDGYKEGMRRDGDRATVWSGAKQSALPAGDGALVADAGFDEYLRSHWDGLLAKGSLPIRFVVPSFGKSLDFSVNSLGKNTIGDTPVQAFRLKLSGMLGLVAPTIDVAYNSGDRSLRRFTGVSNIRADSGKPLKTRIDFARPAAAATDVQWQAATTTPLKRCTLGS